MIATIESPNSFIDSIDRLNDKQARLSIVSKDHATRLSIVTDMEIAKTIQIGQRVTLTVMLDKEND